MNELLNVTINESNEPVMSARQLHEFLEIETPYRLWFPRMTEYGFEEERDYTPYNFVHPQNHQETTDHIIKLDMAKEIAMIQRSDKGKEARQYFLHIEKEWNSPEKVMARALLMADKKVHLLESKIEEQKPLVLFAETCIASNDSILVRELAKLASKNGIIIGEKKLYKKLREWDLILKTKNEPSQRAMDMKLFEVKKGTYTTPYGAEPFSTVKVTPKGQVYIIEKLRKAA